MGNLFKFSEVIQLLKDGNLLARKSWGDAKFICKQVPSEIYCNIIPKMSSLPDVAKTKLFDRDSSLHYKDQLIEIYPDNVINSWSPSAEDIFADDWIVID